MQFEEDFVEYIGQEVYYPELCLITGYSLKSKDYKKNIRLIENCHNIKYVSGKGKKALYVYNGPKSGVISVGNFEFIKEKEAILEYFVKHCLSFNYPELEFVSGFRYLLKYFGYMNYTYEFTDDYLTIQKTDPLEVIEKKKKLSVMSNEIKFLGKYYKSKKRTLKNFLSAPSNGLELPQTFWVSNETGTFMRADMFFHIPTSSLYDDKIVNRYIRDRINMLLQEIENYPEMKFGSKEKLTNIISKRNRIATLNKVNADINTIFNIDDEIIAFRDIVKKYCEEMSGTLVRDERKVTMPDGYKFHPYAQVVKLSRDNPFKYLKECDCIHSFEEVRNARKVINDGIIEDILSIAKTKDVNMEHLNYLIENYVRINPDDFPPKTGINR